MHFVKNINKGEVITDKHIKSIRPGYGMPPKELNNIIGKKILKNVARGSAVKSCDVNWKGDLGWLNNCKNWPRLWWIKEDETLTKNYFNNKF